MQESMAWLTGLDNPYRAYARSAPTYLEGDMTERGVFRYKTISQSGTIQIQRQNPTCLRTRQ